MITCEGQKFGEVWMSMLKIHALGAYNLRLFTSDLAFRDVTSKRVPSDLQTKMEVLSNQKLVRSSILSSA